MKNQFSNQDEEPKKEDQIEEMYRRFAEEHPEIPIQRMKADTPEARKVLAEIYMAKRTKHPEQIIAYETKTQGPYTREQWPNERAFLLKSFRMGMFNKMIYIFVNPDGGGAHTKIANEKGLEEHLARIDEEFERTPGVGVEYNLGMNLEIQGYDSEKQRLIVEKDFRKFKGR